MNHIAAEMIGPLIDGELDGAAQRDAEQHLDACHACALEVLQAMQWKNATALAGDHKGVTGDI